MCVVGVECVMGVEYVDCRLNVCSGGLNVCSGG